MIVVYPGSFDPVHNGHVNLARQVSESESVEQVIMLPSRRNPLKEHNVLASDVDRLNMLRLATKGLTSASVSDLELHLPYPSYTIITLRQLRQMYPAKEIRLLIGADNWANFPQWVQAEKILNEYGLVIYPRPGYNVSIPEDKRILMLKSAPLFPYSSTEIRELLAKESDTKMALDPVVKEYIIRHQLYITENQVAQ